MSLKSDLKALRRRADLTQGATMTKNQKLDRLLIAAKGAVAALSQRKTFPADIEAAKSFLKKAIRDTDETEDSAEVK